MRPRNWGLAVVAFAATAFGSGSPVLASPAQATRKIRYDGRLIAVPRSWPVYDLRRNPTVCVRFDRPAVYLGTPGPDQRCPAHVVGRHRAILIEPGPRSPHVLHAPRLPRSMSRSVLARPAQVGGGIYTGLGFDACSTPSTAAMSAWGSSSYRGIGVYIGGANMACSQPNLTSAWVSSETAAGWHLVPIYVGLQAPNGCCKAIVPSQAQAEGTAAASDAVAHAEAVGIGPGSPIYYDMEAYTRGGTTSSAVLAFLQAWTAQLHADSYVSGVYSSGGSGITDLVGQMGTGYLEPDDIWIAHWNNQQTTSDSYVPSGDWAVHQRLHQYSGGHNETHGGVTINIDGDYLDGATAGGGSGTIGSRPVNTIPPSAGGVATFGNTLAANAGAWSGTSPISYSYNWQRCSSGCRKIAGATAPTYTLVSADIGTRLRVRVTASNSAGEAHVASTAIGPVAPTGYWLFTGAGNVYGSLGTRGFGSPAAKRAKRPAIVGMATTADGGGYWLVGSSGRIWSFGDAAHLGWTPRRQPIAGIAANPAGGYWLFTASGSVYRAGAAHSFGSPAAKHAKLPGVVGMAASTDGGGYWLVGSSGRVWAFGDAAHLGWTPRPQPVAGIVADPLGGYWLFTATGNVYRAGGAGWFGSPAANHAKRPRIVGMAATSDGQGYWLVGASGRVWAYGDAGRFPAPRHARPIVGMAGP